MLGASGIGELDLQAARIILDLQRHQLRGIKSGRGGGKRHGLVVMN